MGGTQELSNESLLILDDNYAVLRSLTRYCRLHFKNVYAASTPAQAEDHLRNYSPQLLLCDYWLGYDSPPATQLIPKWRERFPCLRKVALMTGTSLIRNSAVADATFHKPLQATEVMSFLKAP